MEHKDFMMIFGIVFGVFPFVAFVAYGLWWIDDCFKTIQGCHKRSAIRDFEKFKHEVDEEFETKRRLYEAEFIAKYTRQD